MYSRVNIFLHTEPTEKSQEVSVDVRESLVTTLTEVSKAGWASLETKREIISLLSDNLVEELHAHLVAVDIENANYGKSDSESKEEQLAILRGELFERLVYAEFVYDLQHKRSGAELELAQEALALFHDPERFNIRGGGRNPDLTIIDINTHQIVGIMDAKLGLLGYQAYLQMKGFEKNMSDILGHVRDERSSTTADEFKSEHGLSEDIAQLTLSDNVKKTFVLPADRRNKDTKQLIKSINKETGDYEFPTPEEQRDFEQMLIGREIQLSTSRFYYNEIKAMTKTILAQIRKRY
ncbi:hypothetical protein KJ605_01760 [Patescibacteria group bacterium]|nr:hypothetical protein [Patescibacteria group bacterium]MBU1970481.1 hypothetical protein [Patescibacteria group bacterium]